MSKQIQYNYYNTVATKIGDNTFIFRGKRNSPNLVLPNSDSYVSAKLTILPDEGVVEIEHEPITNYNKRAIVRFPLKLDIRLDDVLGASQEINLNAIISKSIRFDVDDSGEVIRLNPIENSYSVEGFCSKKGKRDLDKQISSEIDRKIDEKLGQHLREANHCGDCNSSTKGSGSGNKNGNINRSRPRPSRFVSANFTEGFKEGNTDDSKCVASVANGEKDEMGYVFSTNPGTEKSVYHTAIMGVIWLVITFFLGRAIVGWGYKKLVNWMVPITGTDVDPKKRNFVDTLEIWLFSLLILTDIALWIAVSTTKSKDPVLNEATYYFTIIIFGLLYFIYDARLPMPYPPTKTAQINDREAWFKVNMGELNADEGFSDRFTGIIEFKNRVINKSS
jgi:hypothetical protein